MSMRENEIIRARLQKDMEAFFGKGGRIQHVDHTHNRDAGIGATLDNSNRTTLVRGKNDKTGANFTQAGSDWHLSHGSKR